MGCPGRHFLLTSILPAWSLSSTHSTRKICLESVQSFHLHYHHSSSIRDHSLSRSSQDAPALPAYPPLCSSPSPSYLKPTCSIPPYIWYNLNPYKVLWSPALAPSRRCLTLLPLYHGPALLALLHWHIWVGRLPIFWVCRQKSGHY